MLTESDVIDAVCLLLKSHRWTIKSVSKETEKGDDITAVGPNKEEVTIEAKGETSSKGYELKLMPAVKDVSYIPTEGKKLIVVANLDNVLHFRYFDRKGKTVVDKNETELWTNQKDLVNLKEQLKKLWPPHKLKKVEDEWIVANVSGIVSHVLLETKSNRFGKPFSGGQAKDHIAKAYYKASQAVSLGKKSGVAFPFNEKHQRYVKAIAPALKKLGITVFWVCPKASMICRIDDYGEWAPSLG